MSFPNLNGKIVALGVCGGIAAYKAVELAREMMRAGAEVRVVMTPSATEFVGPITFSTLTGNPVRTELFPETAPAEIPHTDLARKADIIVVAPATAKIIAKLAQGSSDDLMSSLLLAAKGPVVLAPAMHTEMWENAATKANVETVASYGVRLVGPDTGLLAGGDAGIGRLAPIGEILQAADEELRRSASFAGRHILITAGGTQEAIDAVRFIGNRSSGKMGYALAREALRRGAKVTLITAPTLLTPPSEADVVRVRTAAEMYEAALASSESADVIIAAAAVADWRPVTSKTHKLKKEAGLPEIKLEPTQDIVAEIAVRRSRDQILVGFSAETEELEANASEKLRAKSLDLIVANLVGADDSGFEADTNRAVLMDRLGGVDRLDIMSKAALAGVILDVVAERFL